MFPAVHTLWLLLLLVFFCGLQMVVFYWQDGDAPVLKDYEGSNLIANLFLQASTTRTAGVNSLDIYRFSLGSTYLMVVMMYFSCTPTVVMMRHSALNAGEETEKDITGRAEGIEDAIEGRDDSIKAQASRYLTADLTYLTVILFFILVIERDQLNESATVSRAEQKGDGIYSDYSFFKVVFEMASAYGTVGLSLGYRDAPYSFSGAWSTGAQFLLIVVMLMGRLRGMPDSIDVSVSTMMPVRSGSKASTTRSDSKGSQPDSARMQGIMQKYSERASSQELQEAIDAECRVSSKGSGRVSSKGRATSKEAHNPLTGA